MDQLKLDLLRQELIIALSRELVKRKVWRPSAIIKLIDEVFKATVKEVFKF